METNLHTARNRPKRRLPHKHGSVKIIVFTNKQKLKNFYQLYEKSNYFILVISSLSNNHYLDDTYNPSSISINYYPK